MPPQLPSLAGRRSTSVACSVTLAQGFGAVDDVDAAGAAAEVVFDGLLELLREQAEAITTTAINPDSATDFLTDPPGARKTDGSSIIYNSGRASR